MLFYLIVIASFLFFAGEPWWRYNFGTSIDFIYAILLVRAPFELWAVPVEVQFYALFIIFWIVRSRGFLRTPRSLLLWLAFAFLTAVAITAITVLSGNTPLGLPLYLHLFLLGIISSIFQREITDFINRVRDVIGTKLSLIAVIILTTISLPDVFYSIFNFHIPNRANPIPVASMFILFQLALRGIGILKLLSLKPFLFFGKISYGFYLIHHLVITAMLYLTPDTKGATALLMMITITTFIATISFYVIEKPAAKLFRGL